MSNNMVSQPLSTTPQQMDSTPDKLDVLIPNMQMEMMGGIVASPPQQFAMPNMQMGLVDPVPADFGRQSLMANNHGGNREAITNNAELQKMFLPSKRMANGEAKFNSPVGQPLSAANQNLVPVQPLTKKPVLNQQSSPTMRTPQVHSRSGVPAAPNKKVVRNDSGKPKQTQASKNRVVQMQPSPKATAESSESVRAKMRESLASALSLVAETKDKAPVSNAEKEISPQQLEKSQKDHVETESVAAVKDSPQRSADKANEALSSFQGSIAVEKVGDSVKESVGLGQGVRCGTFFPMEDVPFGDNTFIKDELLQGNGLSWAMDLDIEVEELRDVQVAQNTEVVNKAAVGGEPEPEVRSSERLAFEIEAELFKLFGGVNKKYKEKGRSLLFNLKDRSNPELRERVMSGDIRPERLCSMTPEELASKELSEWRIAKAEEFDHMKVLPDSDVDIRRLVKKTHKGDIEVEVEQDDGVSVEVSIGTGSLPPLQSAKKKSKVHSPTVSEDSRDLPSGKSGSENPESCSLTIPTDGNDFMQGLMVDEFKDAEHLPPIVSLDEFMESLDSEPPFQNLHVEGENLASPTDRKSPYGQFSIKKSPDGQFSIKKSPDGQFSINKNDGENKAASSTDKKSPDGVDEGKFSGLNTKELVEPRLEKLYHSPDVKLTDSDVKKSFRVDVKIEAAPDGKKKPQESPTTLKPSPRGISSKGDHLWEGLLQLNVSAAVTVVGFYKSGEATSAKEWPTCVEIKGRVRMDAFEKFVQGLPMSRSRAVMVTHFVLKEGSSEMDQANFYETSQSLAFDDRLGFAEPVPGVEIYFFPRQSRAVEMLRRNFPINQTEPLNSIENGLIGMIVWRRPLISPNSSSHHHKHGSKKPHFSSTRETNMNLNYNRNVPVKVAQTHVVDDEDDIPPGFGPKTAREDDDLPEFSFSVAPIQPVAQPRSLPYPRGLEAAHSPRPAKPVEAIRELIQKYGKPGSDSGGAGARNWNDEDDDIPEWQPEAPMQPPIYSYQQPMLRPHNHLPQHSGATHHGTRWAPPPALHGSLSGGGHHHGGHQAVPAMRAGQGGRGWRQDNTPRSRGF